MVYKLQGITEDILSPGSEVPFLLNQTCLKESFSMSHDHKGIDYTMNENVMDKWKHSTKSNFHCSLDFILFLKASE